MLGVQQWLEGAMEHESPLVVVDVGVEDTTDEMRRSAAVED